MLDSTQYVCRRALGCEWVGIQRSADNSLHDRNHSQLSPYGGGSRRHNLGALRHAKFERPQVVEGPPAGRARAASRPCAGQVCWPAVQ